MHFYKLCSMLQIPAKRSNITEFLVRLKMKEIVKFYEEYKLVNEIYKVKNKFQISV